MSQRFGIEIISYILYSEGDAVTLRKWINGDLIEGTPEEIAEYERIVNERERVVHITTDQCPNTTIDWRWRPDITCYSG